MQNITAWMTCLVISLAGSTTAAAPDPVEEALSEVRHIKADLFSQESSVLGKLPGPAELGAYQMRCRPIPATKAGVTSEIQFDTEIRQRAAQLDPTALRNGQSRMGLRALPLGITGAYVTEVIEQKELLIVHVLDDSPASDALQIDDIIMGANGRLFSDPEDPRPEMGSALVDSQSPELGGILTLHVVRNRKPLNVTIDLGNTLAYSDTWPFDCEKTRQVRQAAVEFVMSSYPWHRYNFWTPTFLMASGDEAAFELARRHLCAGFIDEYPAGRGCSAWVASYRLINLCEYYLLTGDSLALPAVRYHAECLSWAQYRSGSWSHGGSGENLRAPGTAFGGYGEVNNAGLASFAALAMARECGIEPYDHTLPRSIRFFGQFCGTNFPYGLGRPGGRSGRMDNGMNSMAAFGFHMLGEEEMARRWARTVGYMWMGRERGHAEAIFSAAWGPAGAALAPREEFTAFMQHMLWAYEMGRARDGGLTFMRGSRWTYPNMTAAMGLALCIPERRLQILGEEKSVFAQRPPQGLEKAARLYKEKNWTQLTTFLNDYIKTADRTESVPTGHLEYAKKLLAAHARLEKHAAATLQIIAESIDNGMPATAELQLDMLTRLLGEQRPEAARLRKQLGEGPLKDEKQAKPEPLLHAKSVIQELKLAKGGVRDGFAHSPEYITATYAAGFDGMTPNEIARYLGHFSNGPAGGASAALAARGEKALPLLKQLLSDSHCGIRAGAVATLTRMYRSDSDEYRTEVPEELAQIIKLVRPMTTDASPLVRQAAGGFVVSLKVLNEDVYEMVFEMARQGASGLDGFARHGVKDPAVRTKLCMLLAESALRRDSQSPSTYKPVLYPAMGHMEQCEPYLQTVIDLMSSPTVLNLYGFFSNCPRDASMRIFESYVDNPLVLKNLPVILEVSFHHGRGHEVNGYTIRSVEDPHRIVLKLGRTALPAVDRFLESKRSMLRRIETGQERPPEWWKNKIQPSDYDPWFAEWQRTANLTRILHAEKAAEETVPPLCLIYLTDREWGEWERGKIRDKLIEIGGGAAPVLRRAGASALVPLLADADRRIAAKQTEIEAADKREKKPLIKDLEELHRKESVLQQRTDELNELATLIEHFAADKPSQDAVDDLCRFYVKRTWGTQSPRKLGETSYIRPLYSKPLALVRNTLVRWGTPTLPMIRRFQTADEKVLAAAVADLDQQEAYWKTQWSRKASDPLSRIAMEREDLPRLRAELDDVARLIEFAGRDGLAAEQLGQLCRIYTRYRWPAQRELIREILKQAQAGAAAVVEQHIRAEKSALPEIDAEIDALVGHAVVPRVCIGYNRRKSLAANMRKGLADLETLTQ